MRPHRMHPAEALRTSPRLGGYPHTLLCLRYLASGHMAAARSEVVDLAYSVDKVRGQNGSTDAVL